MRKIKALCLAVLCGLAMSVFAAGKPVGVWKGYDHARLLELVNATVFNPQWSKDKPLTVPFSGKEFDKVSAIVYLHGGNIFRFREIKPAMIDKLEKFVADGGVFIAVIDGGYPGDTKIGKMSKLFGAGAYSTLKGKVDIIDKSWSDCGKNPDVFEHMLAPKSKDGKGELIPVKLTTLAKLTTAKPVIGNASGNLVTVNTLGKGKVYFINVRLSSSYTSYFQHYHDRANAAWDQYLPFAKKIHQIIMETKPALSNEKREIWDPKPLGPKASPAKIKPRTPEKLVSVRKFTKLDGAELPLIVDGKPQALLVVRKIGERGAYNTLNDLLFKMSGTKLPLPNPRAIGEKDGIWKWNGKLFPVKIVLETADHVGVKAQGNLITITAPSPQIGIQTFMREYLNYRMLWPGKDGEVYTKTANIKVSPSEFYDKTPIRQRSLRNGLSCGLYDWETPEGKVIQVHARPGTSKNCNIIGLDVREVIKMRAGHGSWSVVQRLGGSLKEGGGVNFYNWQKKYGKTKPELLALQFETVRKMKTKHVRICKSNPETIKTAVKEALENLKKPRYKDVEYYRFSPSDGGYDIMCMCENCRKWDPSGGNLKTSRFFLGRNRPVYRYPGMTDRVLRFTCEAARELQKHKPGMKVVYLAYAGYLAPPQYYHDVPDNMLVTFVGGQYLNIANRERDREYWRYWSGVAKELCWRPNFLGGGSGMPLMYFREMAKDLKHFAATGMVGGDFDTLPHHWATNALNYYVLARLLWDPALEVEAIIDDFCQSGFGAAAGEMKKYYAHCEKLTEKYIALGGESIEDIEDLTVVPKSGFGKFCHAFTAAEFEKLGSILKNAKGKVAAGSPEARRIEFVETGLNFFKMNREFAMKYWKTPAKQRKTLIPEIDKLIEKWKAMFEKYPFAINLTALVDDYFYTFFRNCGWKPVRPYQK